MRGEFNFPIRSFLDDGLGQGVQWLSILAIPGRHLNMNCDGKSMKYVENHNNTYCSFLSALTSQLSIEY